MPSCTTMVARIWGPISKIVYRRLCMICFYLYRGPISANYAFRGPCFDFVIQPVFPSVRFTKPWVAAWVPHFDSAFLQGRCWLYFFAGPGAWWSLIVTKKWKTFHFSKNGLKNAQRHELTWITPGSRLITIPNPPTTVEDDFDFTATFCRCQDFACTPKNQAGPDTKS